MLNFRASGPAGTVIRIYPSELIKDDGTVNQGSMGAGKREPVFCEFTKATDGVETFAPKFFYVGCRYVQTHCTPPSGGADRLKPGLQTLPAIQSLTGVVVHAACDPVGEFE